MLQIDLAEAGVPYVDANGLFADFHALRHTYITNLARNGVPLVTAQKLARHSTPMLTAQRYTHIDLQDQKVAVDRLPSLQRPLQRAGDFSGREVATDGTSPPLCPQDLRPCVPRSPAPVSPRSPPLCPQDLRPCVPKISAPVSPRSPPLCPQDLRPCVPKISAPVSPRSPPLCPQDSRPPRSPPPKISPPPPRSPPHQDLRPPRSPPPKISAPQDLRPPRSPPPKISRPPRSPPLCPQDLRPLCPQDLRPAPRSPRSPCTWRGEYRDYSGILRTVKLRTVKLNANKQASLPLTGCTGNFRQPNGHAKEDLVALMVAGFSDNHSESVRTADDRPSSDALAQAQNTDSRNPCQRKTLDKDCGCLSALDKAERQGFEPWVPLRVLRFSRPEGRFRK